jgi:Outer membrane protein beta-barrel domain
MSLCERFHETKNKLLFKKIIKKKLIMKKVFLAAFAVITFTVASQAQVKVGVIAGGNLSTQHGNAGVESKLVSNKAFKGYHAGLVADIQVSDHVYIQPQLLYTRKGSKYTSTIGGYNTKLTMKYIEMPINFLYKVDVPFGKIYGGVGPVISYGIGGKLEQNGQSAKIYSGSANDWKRLDLSANAVAGIELNNGLFASVNYQKGFMDVNKTKAYDVKNRSLSLSVGYLVALK